MKVAGKVRRALDWLRQYVGRGKALRAEIAGARAFNADRGALARRIAAYSADRAAKAKDLAKWRTFLGDVKRHMLSDITLDKSVLDSLNARYAEFLTAHPSAVPGSRIVLKRPRLGAGGPGEPPGKIGFGDYIAVKTRLSGSHSLPGDSAELRGMREQLAAMGPAKDVDALRAQLRRYHLVNAGAGAAAVGTAGAGYGAYRLLRDEKRAADDSKKPSATGRSALGDVGAYAASAAVPWVAGRPVNRVLTKAITPVGDGKTIARTAIAIARSRHRRFPVASTLAGGVLGLGGMLYGASGKGSTDSNTLNALSVLGAAGVLPTHLYSAAAINRHLVRRGIRGIGRLRALSPLGTVAAFAAAPHLSALVRRSIDRLRGSSKGK